MIDKKIHDYVKACKAEFSVEKVVLLGGVIINTDPGVDDYFDVRNFEVLNVADL